jgi:putative membrane protein
MRAALLLGGLLTLAFVWFGPLPELAPGSFSAHMTMHMGVVALAAPLIALGLAGSPCDPARFAPRFFAPVPASVVELIAVWAWHAPMLHHTARHTTLGLVLEQGTFLGSGLWVWMSAFGGGSSQRRERIGSGGLALLLTSMHMTLLGALLALTPRVLYRHLTHDAHGAFEGAPQHVISLTPLQDQHLGGAIMLLAGGLSYLFGGLWLTVELLRNMRGQQDVARLAEPGTPNELPRIGGSKRGWQP